MGEETSFKETSYRDTRQIVSLYSSNALDFVKCKQKEIRRFCNYTSNETISIIDIDSQWR